MALEDFRSDDNSDQALRAIREGIVNGAEDIVDDILDRARRKVPVRTGNLQNSLQRDPPQVTPEQVSILFGAFAPYAAAVAYGSGIYSEHPDAPREPITPKNSKALAWTAPGVPRPPSDDGEAWRELVREGKATVVSQVRGQEPQPYLRPSVREVVGTRRGPRLMARALRESLQRRLPRADSRE